MPAFTRARPPAMEQRRAFQAIHETIVDNKAASLDEPESEPLIESVRPRGTGEWVYEHGRHSRIGEALCKRQLHHLRPIALA